MCISIANLIFDKILKIKQFYNSNNFESYIAHPYLFKNFVKIMGCQFTNE